MALDILVELYKEKKLAFFKTLFELCFHAEYGAKGFQMIALALSY